MSGSYYEYLEKQQDRNNLTNMLCERVFRFMMENKIDCSETIYQCNWVIEDAYEFIDDLFKIIKSELPTEE